MGRARDLLLVLFSSLFLAGIVFVYLALSLIHLNLEEIRSLPNTYVWLLKSFLALWLVNALVVLAALRGHLGWLARLLIALGACIFLFDGFRSLWLSTWLQVAVAAVIEIGVVVAVVAGVWRLELRPLLTYAALFAVIPIAGTVAIHVHTVGPEVLWSVAKEIVRPTRAEAAVHADPWRRIPSNAREMPNAIDLTRLSPARSDVEIRAAETIRVESQAPPGATIATLPLELQLSQGFLALVEVQIRVITGDVRVGLKHPVTTQWIYYQKADRADGEHQTLYIPIYPNAENVDLVFARGRVGEQEVAFELERTGVYQIPNEVNTNAAWPMGNVYQILVDGFELAAFREIVSTHPELQYDGFTLYEGFRTSEAKTAWSLPTIFSSTYYDPETGEEADLWRARSFQTGVFSDLRAAGVSSYEYTWVSQYCSKDAHYCYSSQDYRYELLSQVSDNFILDLTFLRTLPNSLRAVLIGSVNQERPPTDSWDYGFSLTAKLGEGKTQTSEDDILREFYFSLNLFTVDFFKRMLVEEAQRPSSGQFVFFHLLIPHSPYARDENCAFIPKDARTPSNQKERRRNQGICALRVVGWLLEQLKFLGRYHDALIIVHADHGASRAPAGIAPIKIGSIRAEDWPNWLVEARSAGLLMVKWPGASGFTTSPVPAQTIDIAPTILYHFGVEQPPHYLGTPLQVMPKDFQRQMIFYAMGTPLVGSSVEYLAKYVKEGDEQWTFKANVPTSPRAASDNAAPGKERGAPPRIADPDGLD